MFTARNKKTLFGLAGLITLGLILSACNLPIPGLPPQAPTGVPAISEAMLTSAAATIQAHLNPQDTPQPEPTQMLPETGIPEIIPSAEAQTLPTMEVPITVEIPPTPTLVAIEQVPNTPLPAQQAVAATPTPLSAIITVIPFIPAPVSPQVVEYGAQFTVQNVNLHACSNGFNAVFKIHNQSSGKLESLSLHIQDINTGAVLLGSWVSNAPFLNTDRTCASGGIDLLPSRQTLYVGNSLGGSQLSGHTIRTTILLCSKESLNGTCSQKMIDFVVP
jgi:hypothetical protein